MNEAPRPLPLSFNRHGHTYEQWMVDAARSAAIYKIKLPGKDKSLLGYEVVRVRIAKESKLPGGKVAPLREVYPGDEEFGTHGWGYSPEQLSVATNKFSSIRSKE